LLFIFKNSRYKNIFGTGAEPNLILLIGSGSFHAASEVDPLI